MSYSKQDGAKPNATERKHYAEMMQELEDLQNVIQEHWVTLSVPPQWNGIEDRVKTRPPHERVNLRLDADVVRWFKKMGYGYTRRINQVLRIYMEGVQSGAVQARHFRQPRLGAIASEIQDEIEK